MSLDLGAFRAKNVARCEDAFYPLDKHGPSHFAMALAGEVGEACNLLRKYVEGKEIPKQAIADELADVFTYLDLLAASLDIDLGESVRRKFNIVSERVGSAIRIEAESA